MIRSSASSSSSVNLERSGRTRIGPPPSPVCCSLSPNFFGASLPAAHLRVSSKHADFSEQYARARDLQADMLFDEALEIADETLGDWITTEDEKKVLDHEHVQRSRLRVDTRKWAAGKLAPKRYGDKLQHTGDGGGPIRVRPDLSKLTDEDLDVLERILGRATNAG